MMRYWNVQEQLVEVLGREKKDIQNLLTCAVLDPELRDTVDTLLRAKAVKRGIQDPGNPPAFGFADDLSTGELIIGRVKVGDVLLQPVGLAEKGKSPSHTAILGQSERGKTFLAGHIAQQAVRRGDRVLVLARDHEWRQLLAMFPAGTVLYLEPHEIGINPLETPRGPDGRPVMSPLDWVLELKVVFRSSVFIRDVGSGLLGRALIRLYRDRGVFDGSDNYPCLSELRASVDSMSLGSGRRLGEAKDSLLDRLDTIIQFLRGLDVVKSRDVHRLFSHSIVLDMSDMHETPYVFLFNFLAMLLRSVFPPED